jgi:hypothetical protein
VNPLPLFALHVDYAMQALLDFPSRRLLVGFSKDDSETTVPRGEGRETLVQLFRAPGCGLECDNSRLLLYARTRHHVSIVTINGGDGKRQRVTTIQNSRNDRAGWTRFVKKPRRSGPWVLWAEVLHRRVQG